ncbi:unnamed protein product [Lepidochelys olivacea]
MEEGPTFEWHSKCVIKYLIDINRLLHTAQIACLCGVGGDGIGNQIKSSIFISSPTSGESTRRLHCPPVGPDPKPNEISRSLPTDFSGLWVCPLKLPHGVMHQKHLIVT